MVTFWDTSALIPLLFAEPATPTLRKWAEETALLVWWGTSTECRSAIARREREGMLSRHEAEQTRQRLCFLERQWSEVVASEEVREHAARALLRHPLRAADALQLGAALRWADGRPKGHRFLTLDHRLDEAAHREGFETLGPEVFGT